MLRVLLWILGPVMAGSGSIGYAAGPAAQVGYSVSTEHLEGFMPFTSTYALEVTAPANFTPGASATVDFRIMPTMIPAGLTAAAAATYVTIAPAPGQPAAFTGPGQTIQFRVTAAFPLLVPPAGAGSVSYAYQIYTTGWPSAMAGTFVDFGTAISATMTLLSAPAGPPPTVEISTPEDGAALSYAPSEFPVRIPLKFQANATTGFPISSIDASFDSVSVAVTGVGLDSAVASGTASLVINGPGTYIVDARGSNSEGTGSDRHTFTVGVLAQTPTVVIQTPSDGATFTYLPVTNKPVVVPIKFAVTVPAGGAPITDLGAELNGVSITVIASGVGTTSAFGTFSPSFTVPGEYTVCAFGRNAHGTAFDTTDFRVVVSAPPPTIAIASPVAGATYTIPFGGSGVTVPFKFTATSLYGNITAISGTLNGAPLTLTTSGVGTTASANGSASANIMSPGSYIFTAEAANAFGSAPSQTVQFSVKSGPVPPPTIAFQAPVTNTVYERCAGDPATRVVYKFSGTTPAGTTITSVVVTLNGTVVAPTLAGLGSTGINGSGTLSITAPGVYKLVATDSNGHATATDETTFVVKEKSREISVDVTWLPPISLNQPLPGGKCFDLEFKLTANGKTVFNEDLLVAIYEIYSNGSNSRPRIYPYRTNRCEEGYTIDRQGVYSLELCPEKGKRRYRIELYHPLNASGSSLQLLGTKEFVTEEEISYSICLESASYSSSKKATTFTYTVKSNPCGGPALSHWVLGFPKGTSKPTIVCASEGEVAWTERDPTTGLRGIKFDREYRDGQRRTVSVTLAGRWDKGCVAVAVKAGREHDTGTADGPVED